MRLLMLDFDLRLVSAVTRALHEDGVEVVGVQSAEQARECAACQSFDVALLDCDLLDPAEMLAFADLPVILTTSFLEPEGEHRFFRHARLLRKPFTSAQLLSALHETCGTPRAEMGRLVDVLRRAHTSGLSLALRVGSAELFIEQGELVHAELCGLSGESALAEVLAQSQQQLVTIESRPVVRTIRRPFRALLLDLLRRLEEREQRELSARADPNPGAMGKDPYS
jgi:DNA-binding response OmpR family regulator